MTLDETIAHEKEVAKETYVETMLCHANPDDGKLDDCIESGKYHEQLAEWLEELKMYKSLAPRELISEKQKNDRVIEYSKGFDYAMGSFGAGCVGKPIYSKGQFALECYFYISNEE